MSGSTPEAAFALTLAWAPAIGDPTILGWTITIAYAVAVWLSLKAAAVAMRRSSSVAQPARTVVASSLDRQNISRKQREYLVRFWCFAAFMLAILCVNKQLDLQTLFTESAREIAKSGGWYRERKSLQFSVLALFFAVSVLLALWMLWALRPSLSRVWLAVLGLVVLAAYVAMRGTSHHAVDAFMSRGPVPLKNSLELIGIALLAWSAWRMRA